MTVKTRKTVASVLFIMCAVGFVLFIVKTNTTSTNNSLTDMTITLILMACSFGSLFLGYFYISPIVRGEKVGNAPTLGGLKAVYELLKKHGYELPFLQGVWDDRYIPLSEAVEKMDCMQTLGNVRLTDGDGGNYLEFAAPFRPDIIGGVWIEISPDQEFKKLIEKLGVIRIMQIARYGKEPLSPLRPLLFSWFPKVYERRVFTRA